jgi:MFS family permease
LIAHLYPLTSLLLGVALLLLGNGLLGTLLAVRGGIEGFTSQTLGILGAMYFVGFLAGTYLGPAMIRRVGHVRAFSFFTAAIACAVLLHEMLPVAWVWGLLRVITGMAMVGLYTTIESWLNSYAPAVQRTRIFAAYMAVNLGALALSQQFLHWATADGHTLFVIATLAICAAVMPVSATRLSQPVVADMAAVHLSGLYAAAPVAVAASLISGLAQGAFWGLGAVWADKISASVEDVAWFMSLTIIGGAVFQWPIGFLTDRLERAHVISVVSLIAAALAVVLLLAGRQGGMVAGLAGFAYGGFAFSLYPMAVARMMDRLDPRDVVSGSAGLLLIHGCGAIVGPLVAGVAMSAFGPDALPGWFVLCEIALAVTAWLMSRKIPGDVEHQTHFVPMVRTASTAFDMAGSESTGGHKAR